MLSAIDNIIVAAAVVGILFVAAYFSKTVQDMESYFVCNKALPWSLTVGTLVSTWYGGVGTLGSVEWFAIYGLSMFIMWCFTAHAARIPLALWIGPKMQIRTDITVPDVLKKILWKEGCDYRRGVDADLHLPVRQRYIQRVCRRSGMGCTVSRHGEHRYGYRCRHCGSGRP